MSETHNYCVILAGGIGSRFWPVSREAKPKQFLKMTSGTKSMLRMTYDRMATIVPKENILVVTLSRYRDLVRENIPEIDDRNILAEPLSRNTAPSIAYATYELLKRDPQAVMVATPSDHMITNIPLFRDTVYSALVHASLNDVLITLGIIPTRPDSNFGYIQMNGGKDSGRGGKPVPIKTFTEKPDAELAKEFIKSGEFLWNSGLFVWKAETIRKEMEKLCPEITSLWEGWETGLGADTEVEFLESVYSDCPKISIDYAVMEKTDKGWVYPASFGWADIGTWESLYDFLSRNGSQDNALSIKGASLLKENHNSIMYSDGDKLVAIRGLENFVVIDTDDVLLICPRNEKYLKDFISDIAMPDFEEYR